MSQPRKIDGEQLLRPPGDHMQDVAGSKNRLFNNALIRAVADATWNFTTDAEAARLDRIGGALAALKGFAPRDEVEGMMAAQAVAMHLAAMECARRAMLPDQPSDAAHRLRKDAANMARAMVDMAEAIERRRGKGPQVVRVERVVVHEGGQAIVGNVTTGGGARTPGAGSKSETEGRPHAPRAIEEQQPAVQPELGPALRRGDPERAPLPRASDG